MSNIEDESSIIGGVSYPGMVYLPPSGIARAIWGHLYHLTCADGNQSGPQWDTSLLSGSSLSISTSIPWLSLVKWSPQGLFNWHHYQTVLIQHKDSVFYSIWNAFTKLPKLVPTRARLVCMNLFELKSKPSWKVVKRRGPVWQAAPSGRSTK